MKRFSMLLVLIAALTGGTANQAWAEPPPTKPDGAACMADAECINSCIGSKCQATPAALSTEQGTLIDKFLEETASKLTSLWQAKSRLKTFLKTEGKPEHFDRLATYLASMDVVMHPCEDDSEQCYVLAVSIYFGFGPTVETATKVWESKQNWARARFNAKASADLAASFAECFPGVEYTPGIDSWRTGTEWVANDPLFVCRAKERFPSRASGSTTRYAPYKPTRYAPLGHDHDERYYRKSEVDERIPRPVSSPPANVD